MGFADVAARARQVRALYAERRPAHDGRPWDASDHGRVCRGALDIELEAAFLHTVDELDQRLRQHLTAAPGAAGLT